MASPYLSDNRDLYASLSLSNDSASIMERQRQRHKRLSLLEMTSNEKSGMAHAWITRARQVLGRFIEHDPVKKDKKIALLRAFLIWSERLPLYQKCNELGRQLQERHLMLTTVKDSYIRDVIR